MREFLEALMTERHEPVKTAPPARYGGKSGLEAAAAEKDAWHRKQREEATK